MKLNCILVVVIASLVLIEGTPASSAKVIGKDTRISIPNDHRQLARGVGKLYDAGTRSSCTAFCVAPNVIMTNAHCAAWKLKKYKYRRRDVRDFSFRMIEDGYRFDKATLAWNNIEPMGRVETSVVFGRELKGVLKRKSNDWALAKLYRPICNRKVLKIANASGFKLLRRRRKLKVFTIGFHSDIAKSAWGQGKRFTRCVLSNHTIKRLVKHTCDNAPWSSGSPIFISTPDGPRVIAIHQGWRGYHRWRRKRSGKKKITKRWTNNYGVLLFGLADKVERLSEISFVHHSKRLKAEQFAELLREGGLLKKRRQEPSLRSVQAAIRRFEIKQGWIPISIPSEQLIDALTKAH